jgi:zinc/manganese transport system permease protein
LIDQLLYLLNYEFVQNAIAAGFVIAIVCGVVSRFVVARDMSFAVHALAEIGFTGAAGFVFLRLPPVLGLLTGASLSAIFIGALGVRVRGRDNLIGVTLAFGLGLGVLFISLYRQYATQAFAILFGTITGVSRDDVFVMIVLGVATLVALAVVYRPLTFMTVDPEVAEARGVPVGPLGIVFLLIMAVAIVEAVQVVGVLLILTLMITPGAAAERLAPQPGRAVLYGVAIAVFCTLGGILLALLINWPVSFFVTGLSFVVYVTSRLLLGPFLQRRAVRGSETVARAVPSTHHSPGA